MKQPSRLCQVHINCTVHNFSEEAVIGCYTQSRLLDKNYTRLAAKFSTNGSEILCPALMLTLTELTDASSVLPIQT